VGRQGYGGQALPLCGAERGAAPHPLPLSEAERGAA